ncbi:MAG TPA: hypothetical protein VNZ45_17750, partial [Bacteroidia bacterium]|nr:hypothetical protein [Bacteroidia bacterium]
MNRAGNWAMPITAAIISEENVMSFPALPPTQEFILSYIFKNASFSSAIASSGISANVIAATVDHAASLPYSTLGVLIVFI